MKINPINILILVISFSFFSCGMERRVYRNGFYFDRDLHKNPFRAATQEEPSQSPALKQAKTVNAEIEKKCIPDNSIDTVPKSAAKRKSGFVFRMPGNHKKNADIGGKENAIVNDPKSLSAPPEKKSTELAEASLTLGLLGLLGAILAFVIMGAVTPGGWVWIAAPFAIFSPIMLPIALICGIAAFLFMSAQRDPAKLDKLMATVGTIAAIIGIILLSIWVSQNPWIKDF